MNIHSWAELGGIQGKAKVIGMGMGGRDLWESLSGEEQHHPGMSPALAPPLQHSGPIHSQTPPFPRPYPLSQNHFPTFLQKPR